MTRRQPKIYTTIEELLMQAEEVGECMEWQSKFSNSTPIVSHGGTRVYVRRLIIAMQGIEIPPNHFASTTCRNKRCVTPGHIVIQSTSEHSRRMETYIDHNAPARVAKLQASAAKRRKTTDEQDVAIRNDQRPAKEIAAEYGICVSLVFLIKSSRIHRVVNAANNPWSQLMRA